VGGLRVGRIDQREDEDTQAAAVRALAAFHGVGRTLVGRVLVGTDRPRSRVGHGGTYSQGWPARECASEFGVARRPEAIVQPAEIRIRGMASSPSQGKDDATDCNARAGSRQGSAAQRRSWTLVAAQDQLLNDERVGGLGEVVVETGFSRLRFGVGTGEGSHRDQEWLGGKMGD